MSRRIGVEVTTSAVHTATPPAVPGAGTVFVPAITQKGSTSEAILLESMSDYATRCGERTADVTAYDFFAAFFGSGKGKRAYVSRVVGTTPVKASRMLVDKAGTPLDTLKVEAVDAGVWGNSLKVAVAAGTRANTFRLTITDTAGTVLADVNNITTPAVAEQVFSTNRYVRVTDQGSATVAPNNNPAVLSATSLAGGDDDLDTVTTATPYITALTRFGEELGAGCVCIPGQAAADIVAGVDAHCALTGTRVGLISIPFGTNKAGALAAAEAILSSGSEYISAPLYPWLSYVDQGTVRWVDPVAHGAAARSAAQADGAWQAAAAYPYGRSTFFTGAEWKLSRADVNDLVTGNVNPIIIKNNQAVLRGWFALTESVDYPSLAVRDLMNVISADLTVLLDEDLVWRPVDGHGTLAALAKGLCTPYLEKVKIAGGLFERYAGQTLIDPGYMVDTGPSVNTTETLSQGEFHVRVGIRPAPHASLVMIDLIKVGIGSSL